MLIIATILLCIPLMGYSMKVLRGEKPAPEVEDWGTLFIDGIKYLIVSFIYAIPIIIVMVIVMGSVIGAAMIGDANLALAAVGTLLVGMVVVLVLSIIIALFEVIGIVRLARTGSIGEAFNFSAILATIRKIGWVPYILALIVFVVCGIIFEIIAWILMMIPFLGIILVLCLIPPWTIFIARYFSQLYDSAGA
jgi:hypothetical protein